MITQNEPYVAKEDSSLDATKNGLIILSQQLCNVANELARKNRLHVFDILLKYQSDWSTIKTKDIIEILENYINTDGRK